MNARTSFSAALLLASACADPARSAPRGTLVVAQETQAAWVRNFNPLLPEGTSRWPTRGGIYEPLAVYNRIAGEWVPWLGTAWEWADGGRTLTFTLRPDVKWSDGTAFTARDVAFTFELLRDYPALDLLGIWRWLGDVEAQDDTVVFHLPEPYAPGFEDLAEQPLVPRHIWRTVKDPVRFANPNPIATGPFTEVRRFETGVFELGRNPDYWQPGAPEVETLRMPAFAGNEAANLALVAGEVDWAGNYVPAVDRTFLSRDPLHNLAWSPPVEATVFLYANTTVPPFGDVRVRRALSRAVDRDRLVRIAMEGATHPADGTGLSDALASWRAEGADNEWVTFDPERARALLDEANVDPNGGPYELLVVAGWSDWIRAAQLVARDLGAVGLDVTVRTADFGTWLSRVQRGDFDLTIGWSAQGPTPYAFYRELLGTSSVHPVGEPAGNNWHRYGSPAAEALLDAIEVTPDPDAQRPYFTALEALFAAEAPAVPLFPAPAWGVASTRRFVGFPTPDDPWVALSPNHPPETLLLLTTLRPR